MQKRIVQQHMRCSPWIKRLIICGWLIALHALSYAQEGTDVPVDSPEPLRGFVLAPERPLRTDFAPEVEALLAGLEARALADQMHLRLTWEVSGDLSYDWTRESVGIRSFKTSLDWCNPPAKDAQERHADLRAVIGQRGFDLVRLDADGNNAECWRHVGEYIYSSRLSELLPFVMRWRAPESLETGMLAYCEGLGLLLWACAPGKYLRHSANLALGDQVVLNGKAYQELRAVPEWIMEPPTLPGRTYYPFNHVTFSSWAELYPEVTYYVDPTRYRIEGARFSYFKAVRSHRGRWTAVPTPKGEFFEAWIRQWANGPPAPLSLRALRAFISEAIK